MLRALGFFVLLSMMFHHAQADEEFPGIRALMTEEEFMAAGLDKQSQAELEALNRWLIRYTANDAPLIKNTVEEVKQETDKEIRSRIVGEFTGWDGDTVFRLANGQVWQQRLDGRWRTKLKDPEVIIKRNIFGFYKMRVDDKRSVGVKRIK